MTAKAFTHDHKNQEQPIEQQQANLRFTKLDAQ
jgi:hypothetical protein